MLFFCLNDRIIHLPRHFPRKLRDSLIFFFSLHAFPYIISIGMKGATE